MATRAQTLERADPIIRAFVRPGRSTAGEDVPALVHLLERTLPAHFAFEEQPGGFFDQLRAADANETAERLTRDHAEFCRNLQQLSIAVEAGDGAVATLLDSLAERLRAHERIESFASAKLGTPLPSVCDRVPAPEVTNAIEAALERLAAEAFDRAQADPEHALERIRFTLPPTAPQFGSLNFLTQALASRGLDFVDLEALTADGPPRLVAAVFEPGPEAVARMKVLFAVDIRTDAGEVVAKGIPWVERLDAVVDLVFVDDYRALLALHSADAIRVELDRLVHEAERKLGEVLSALPARNRGTALVDPTSVEEMIEARSREYGMTIVGTRGRVGLAHLWAGSVAERLIRFSTGTVLVLKDQSIKDPIRILQAVDLSEDPVPLITALAALAERLGAQVDLLAVYEVPVVAARSDSPSLHALLAEYGAETRVAMTARLNDLLLHFSAAARGTVHVAVGPPLTAILQHVPNYDLVAVGTHGRVGIAHAVLGSVAERVARRSTRPVLVLRA